MEENTTKMEQVGIQLVIRRGDANGKFGMVISNGKHKSLKVRNPTVLPCPDRRRLE